MEDTIILWRLRLTNTGSMAKSFHIGLAADGEPNHAAAGLEIRAVALLDEVVDHFAGGGARLRVVSLNSFGAKDAKWKMTAIYRFLDGAEAKSAEPEAQWTMLLKPGESREIRFLMSATDLDGRQSPEADRATSTPWFEAQWERAKREERWSAAFTPGNPFFSGNAPVLMTDDSAIREIYYRSVLTLLVLLRTNLSNRTFITSGELVFWRAQCFIGILRCSQRSLLGVKPKQDEGAARYFWSRILTRMQ